MTKTKVHKITIMIVDHDGLGAEECAKTIENARYPNRCINPRVFAAETVGEVAWDDDHPLNVRDTWKKAFADMFKVT